MELFKKSRELISITFSYTNNYPKVDRYTMKDKIRELALKIYEDIVLANEIFIDTDLLEKYRKSINGIT